MQVLTLWWTLGVTGLSYVTHLHVGDLVSASE